MQPARVPALPLLYEVATLDVTYRESFINKESWQSSRLSSSIEASYLYKGINVAAQVVEHWTSPLEVLSSKPC